MISDESLRANEDKSVYQRLMEGNVAIQMDTTISNEINSVEFSGEKIILDIHISQTIHQIWMLRHKNQ